jgi:hypothetical protein
VVGIHGQVEVLLSSRLGSICIVDMYNGSVDKLELGVDIGQFVVCS